MKKINNVSIFFYLKRFYCNKILFKFENAIEKLFFGRNNTINKSKKIIDFSVYFWGNEHCFMLENVLIPSLLQIDNVPKLKKEKYTINLNLFVKKDWDSSGIEKRLLSNKVKKFFNVNFFKLSSKNYNDKYFLMHCHYKAAKISFKNGSIFSLLAPDLFFGNRSIYNMIKLVDNENSGIVANPVRVDKHKTIKFIKKYINNKSISNFDLFKFSKNNLHNSFSIDGPTEGQNINRFNNKTILASFERKTCNFIRLNESDIKIFEIYHDFNLIDKHWPRKLFLEGRLKSLSDLSLYFHVELTDKTDKQVVLVKKRYSNKKRKTLLNLVNLSNLIIWRD